MSLTYVLRDEYPRQALEMMVSGRDRHIYFKRPIIPLLQPQIPEVVMQLHDSQKPHESLQSEIKVEATKTVEIQTMFRESEAQTIPYSPEYTIKPGEDPEVLNFTYFVYGNGLPASMTEMELIEQSREKRLFESMLPSSTDEACFLLRRKLMDEQEFKEWAKRENDIKRIQNERLNLLHTALIDREKENNEKNAQRVDEMKLKKTEQKDRALVKIGRKRIKVLRKMFKQRKAADSLGVKRDIIEEYNNFGSSVYAGITREGLNLDKLANKYEVQPEVLTTYQGLTELSESLPNKILQTTYSIKQEQIRIDKGYNRKEIKHRAALSKAQKAIDIMYKIPSEGEESKGAGRHSVAEIRDRADTPIILPTEDEKDDNDAIYVNIILLQRLLRGRSIQNIMFKGKEKRLDLIGEVRRCGEMIELTEEQKEKEILEAYRERIVDGLAEALQGEFVSDTLDALSKELVRLKQERKISAIVKFAERERRKKECEEAGRRQAEEILRNREDAMFREIMETNQGTVDTYLQFILTDSVDKRAYGQAIDEAQLRAFHINRIVDNMEERNNQPHLVVKDLVSSFLMPEVQRLKIQNQMRAHEKRNLAAARAVLKEAAVRARRNLNTIANS
jgi:Cilia- and flagella-associated protein 91